MKIVGLNKKLELKLEDGGDFVDVVKVRVAEEKDIQPSYSKERSYWSC